MALLLLFVYVLFVKAAVLNVTSTTRFNGNACPGCTRRGLKYMKVFDFPAFNSAHYLRRAASHNGTFLELGAGLGVTLLELQYAYPSLRCYGLNKDGYHLDQANSVGDLISAAAALGIPIHVTKAGLLLPQIQLFDGFPEELPYSDSSFDLVYSRDALNEGKIKPSMAHVPILQIARVLRVGGFALCFLFSLRYGDNPFNGPVLMESAVLTLPFAYATVGVYLSDVNGYAGVNRMWTVFYIIHKCHSFHCELPHAPFEPTAWPKFVQRSKAEKGPYIKDYMNHMVEFLQKSKK